MILKIDYDKFKKELESKTYEELIEMRNEYLKDIYAHEKRKSLISAFEVLYMENNMQLSLIIDFLNMRYDEIQSGYGKEETWKEEQNEQKCPRCGQLSKHYRYCPYCNFQKL